MNVSVSPYAEQELIDAAMFYAERADRELGLAFIAEFEHARDLLSTNPEIGVQWRAVRRLTLRRFPFDLIYQIELQEVRVIALAHQRRRPGYWASRA